MILTAKKHKGLATAVIAGAMFLGGGTSYVITHNSEQAGREVDAVRQSQVDACEASISPGGFRAQIAGDYRAEIKTHKGNIRRTRTTNFAKFSIVISEKNRRNAIERDRRAITHLRDKIQNVLDVNCRAVYPKP